MSGVGEEPPFRLLVITRAERDTPDEEVRVAVAAGGERIAVLLRDRALGPEGLRRWAERLLPVCRAAGALLLVHGDAASARKVGADGAHLPEGASVGEVRRVIGAGGLLGVSRHDAAGLAASAGADYATVSPVFATPDKGAPLGTAALAALCRAAPLPVFALGGVAPGRVAECRAAGAAGIAAIRAVWKGDAGANVRRLLAGWDAGLL